MSEYKALSAFEQVELQERIAYLEGLVALQADALNTLKENYEFNDKRVPKFLLRAISASAETVAAFKDKITEPLRREVSMLHSNLTNLRDQIQEFAVHFGEADFYTGDATKAIIDTQATAQAYDQKMKREGAVKALEEITSSLRIKFTGNMDRYDMSARFFIDYLVGKSAELRATSKKAG